MKILSRTHWNLPTAPWEFVMFAKKKRKPSLKMVTIDGAVYINKSSIYMSFKVRGCLAKKILHLTWIYQELYQIFIKVGVILMFFKACCIHCNISQSRT